MFVVIYLTEEVLFQDTAMQSCFVGLHSPDVYDVNLNNGGKNEKKQNKYSCLENKVPSFFPYGSCSETEDSSVVSHNNSEEGFTNERRPVHHDENHLSFPNSQKSSSTKVSTRASTRASVTIPHRMDSNSNQPLKKESAIIFKFL